MADKPPLRRVLLGMREPYSIPGCRVNHVTHRVPTNAVGLTRVFSTQSECHATKLKRFKRQMYDRASIELLRRRVLLVV